MLASRTTLPHLAISTLMRSPNSSGVFATGAKPSVFQPLLDLRRRDDFHDLVAPALDDLPWRAGRSHDAGERVALQPGHAGFGVGRHVGQRRRALGAEHREPAQLALPDIGHRRRQRRERDRRVAADGRIDRQRRAVERHGDEVEPVFLLEQLAGEVGRRAGGGLRKAVLVRIGFDQIDQFLERRAGKAGMRRDHVGRGRHQGDRRESP